LLDFARSILTGAEYLSNHYDSGFIPNRV